MTEEIKSKFNVISKQIKFLKNQKQIIRDVVAEFSNKYGQEAMNKDPELRDAIVKLDQEILTL